MEVVSPDVLVIKNDGTKIHPKNLQTGETFHFPALPETEFETVSIDNDALICRHGDEFNAMYFNQSIVNDINIVIEQSRSLDLLARLASDANAEPDRDIDPNTIDETGLDADVEGAAFSFDPGRILRDINDNVVDRFNPFSGNGIGKRIVSLIPDPVNPCTGNGILTSLVRVAPANYDILKTGPQLAGLQDLRPGDILLKQLELDPKHLDSLAITLGQSFLNNSGHPYLGACLLTHALIYIGDGLVIEAVSKGVGVTPLYAECSFNGCNYSNFNFYVLRSKHADVVREVINTAKTLVTTTRIHDANTRVKVAYNIAELALGIGEKLTQILYPLPSEAIKLIKLGQDATKDFTRALNAGNSPQLFCSELVAYCYHVAADKTDRERFFKRGLQNRITPEHLYVLGRSDPDNFNYVGELHKGKR
ncbi:hypothetical protein [Azospirillum sp. Sh1]|uniref:hypothetical protein n=1 Tax=Azospirillum sp. Sh1 TaxID=2607285 RepID=UPI0011EF1F09|nr:hypothetical protein [Azospirillum sp. Sh1]KAA0573181.1 hypothetical protein FZ029_21200 [Azospirillum sp. Sh1]